MSALGGEPPQTAGHHLSASGLGVSHQAQLGPLGNIKVLIAALFAVA
jgi:hypothetical protein